jgi:hypothetical protein
VILPGLRVAHGIHVVRGHVVALLKFLEHAAHVEALVVLVVLLHSLEATGEDDILAQ